jgi:hypothetical protein
LGFDEVIAGVCWSKRARQNAKVKMQNVNSPPIGFGI